MPDVPRKPGLHPRATWPVSVHPLADPDADRRDRDYWLSRTPTERVAAVEQLVLEAHGPQPRLARVARVTELKPR